MYDIAVRMRSRNSSSSADSVSGGGEGAGEVTISASCMVAGTIICCASPIVMVCCLVLSVIASPATLTECATKSFFWLRNRLGEADTLLWPLSDPCDSFLRLFDTRKSL